MKNYGFIRVAAAVPSVRVADTAYNVSGICRMTDLAEKRQVSILLFPELCVTGYTCGDLFGQRLLIDEAEKGVKEIMEFTRGKSVTVIIGAPVSFRGRLYDCAIVLKNGNIKGVVPKIWLPNYNEFYEARWFSSGSDFLNPRAAVTGRNIVNGKDSVREGFPDEIEYAGFRCNISPNLLFETDGTIFGIEICEDMWTPVPPSTYHALAGAQIIFNPSASNEVVSKHEYRKSLMSQISARNVCGYVYASSGFGESTQDLVFGGAALIHENGILMAESERFSTEPSMTVADLDTERLDIQRQKISTFSAVSPDGTFSAAYRNLYSLVRLGGHAVTDFGSCLYRHIEKNPFVPAGNEEETSRRCREILAIQVTGLASRLAHIRTSSAVVGISGGLDSTLALLVTVLAFDKLGLDRKGIIGITMPGYLQWGRMWRYASPAILLIILYIATLLLGNRPQVIHSYDEFATRWWGPDMLFRLAGFGLSIYYVVNILRLPHVLAKNAEIPRYVKGYVTAMGFSMVFYVVAAAVFNVTLLLVYFYLFCLLNMYLFFRTLETMAMHLPKPEMVAVEEAPAEEAIVRADQEDFNEANLRRFERVEYFMQHEREWEESSFGRDRLCEATGINRHLLLQCLRSQGYNDTHEYIYRYRVEELKRLILSGEMQSLQECERAGFRSVKMAYSNFERMENVPLDIWFDEHKRPVPDTMEEQADTTPQHPINK